MGQGSTLGVSGPVQINGYLNVNTDVNEDFEVVRRELPCFDGIYLVGQIQGVGVEITVDTGASVTLISWKLYNSLPSMERPALEITHQKVSTADGSRMECKGTAVLEMVIRSVRIQRRFLVADIQDEVLMGADILLNDEFGPVDLLLSEDMMVIQGEKVPLKQVFTPKCTSTVKVRSATTCTLPTMSEMMVEVKFDVSTGKEIDDNLLLEADPTLAEKYGLVMARC